MAPFASGLHIYESIKKRIRTVSGTPQRRSPVRTAGAKRLRETGIARPDADGRGTERPAGLCGVPHTGHDPNFLST